MVCAIGNEFWDHQIRDAFGWFADDSGIAWFLSPLGRLDGSVFERFVNEARKSKADYFLFNPEPEKS